MAERIVAPRRAAKFQERAGGRGPVRRLNGPHLSHMETQGRCYFLRRPRRFGMSLLVSTLETYFEGRRDLLERLAIAQLEPEWTQHPVLHVDFSGENYKDTKTLGVTLNTTLL